MIVDFFESHWSATWLKENILVLEFYFTIENVFEIQTCVIRHKDASIARLVPQIPNPVVTRAMLAGCRIVANHSRNLSNFECRVSHVEILTQCKSRFLAEHREIAALLW